ncbi:MAG: DUF4124 domain-containing protein [Neisseria sp.]|nr:DUF4124 domain-containing protein [Neisseria sp.]
MHITIHARKLLLAAVLLSAAHASYAAVKNNEVYRWKDKASVNTYSDTPRKLTPSDSTIINIRTNKVIPPATSTVQPAAVTTVGDPAATPGMGGGAVAGKEPPTLADQQKMVNDQIAEQNRAAEKRNKEIEEQNRQAEEANCKTAQMNHSFAQNARTNNREALLERYSQDIAKYCK